MFCCFNQGTENNVIFEINFLITNDFEQADMAPLQKMVG